MRLRNTISWGGSDGDYSIGHGAEAEGRVEKEDADEDGRKKWRGRGGQKGTLRISRDHVPVGVYEYAVL